MPVLTVITVVYNAREAFRNTLESLNKQTSRDFEYIVIDGKSKDGTLEELVNFPDINAKVICESDRGIYDAMNKGIALANGKYLYFLNAGDCFFEPSTLEKVLRELKSSEVTIVHGAIEVQFEGQNRFKPAFSPSDLWQASNFCHQGIFVKSDYHKTNPYDLSFAITADYKLVYDAYKNGMTFQMLPLTIAHFMAGGISDKNRIKLLREKFKIVSQYEPWKHFFYYHIKIADSLFRQFVKAALPVSVVKKIILLKYDKKP